MIQRIPTRRRNIIVRAALWLWDACDRYQWLPMAIVFVLLVIINSVERSAP